MTEPLLNAAALRAVGYDKNAPDFPAGEVSRDRHGNPTGLLIANTQRQTLSIPPSPRDQKLSREDQLNSSRLFFPRTKPLRHHQARSMPVADFRNYPDDYGVVNELHRNGRAVDSPRIQPLYAEAEAGTC